MKTKIANPRWALFITVLMITMFALASAAQKMPTTLWVDTAINPHDFTDEFYASNGILSKAIVGRRTGTDMLSVFSYSSNPNHTRVRVIATLSAYGPSGEILFWYPLGELNDNGFTNDKAGIIAREAAFGTPVYIFPLMADTNDIASFSNVRHSALFGPGETYYPMLAADELIIRRIVEVRYTAKAFDKEYQEMMAYMGDKNGAGVDGLPIIRTMDDLMMFAKHELVATSTKSLWDDPSGRGIYALAPVMADPTRGAIAPDAFLLMPTVDGKPLASEQMFATQFGCLQKYGYWCKP
jgi:hypothetical protein